jgi:hypothetical protein
MSNSFRGQSSCNSFRKIEKTLSLCMMVDMFSLKDMLNFLAEGEGKDELSPREQEFPKE